MISIKRLKFNFINVPKNASTSVRRFFIDNVVQPEDAYSNYFDGYNIQRSQNMRTEHAHHSHMDVTFAIDNGLLDPSETIVGVIRNPIERVVSLFLYREKQRLSPRPQTIQDFRKWVSKHGYLPDRPWQNQLQSSFLTYQGKEIGQWWLFENIQQHIDDFSAQNNIKVNFPLEWKNKSIGGRTNFTKDWLHVFYDDASLAAVNKYYQKDIELYEGLKC